MIFVFTDYGHAGPYVGQVMAVLARTAPAVPVIEMFSDLPAFDPMSASYLLPAYSQQAQPGDVVLAVVDPGVGTARGCVVVQADGVWFVGPDNGLLAHVIRRAHKREAWSLGVPDMASATFHGRDVFAPAAARLALGQAPDASPLDAQTLDRPDWPDDRAAAIYIDGYGNVMTGLRVRTQPEVISLTANRVTIQRQRTFADGVPGVPFFYANANGLWEIAVNGSSAAVFLGLKVGSTITVES
jgi:S-adenosylmethionine hydrolase